MRDELSQNRSSIDPHSAASRIDIRPDDREISLLGVCGNSGRLVLSRIALKLRRHADILRRAKRLLGLCQLRIAANDTRIDHGFNAPGARDSDERSLTGRPNF